MLATSTPPGTLADGAVLAWRRRSGAKAECSVLATRRSAHRAGRLVARCGDDLNTPWGNKATHKWQELARLARPTVVGECLLRVHPASNVVSTESRPPPALRPPCVALKWASDTPSHTCRPVFVAGVGLRNGAQVRERCQ